VTVEEALLEWLDSLGYQVVCGPDIAPGTPSATTLATSSSARAGSPPCRGCR